MGWFRLWLLKRRFRYNAKRIKIINPDISEDFVHELTVKAVLQGRTQASIY